MMRSKFEQELERLGSELTEMGMLTEKAIDSAVRAFTSRDAFSARQAIESDHEIDQMEKEIEDMCLRLLLRQQPVARDLRFISAALKMITDMERIGDQASDISELVLFMLDAGTLFASANIAAMGNETRRMVTESVKAFVDRDIDLAHEVIARDDIVDALFAAVRDDLARAIRDNGAISSQALDLLMIAKYLERIGDHATNIAEWVEFSITGVHLSDEMKK